jgi:hypothetical protein
MSIIVIVLVFVFVIMSIIMSIVMLLVGIFVRADFLRPGANRSCFFRGNIGSFMHRPVIGRGHLSFANELAGQP